MKKLGAAWLSALGASAGACALAAACHVYVDPGPQYSSPPPPQRQYQYSYAAPPPAPPPPPPAPAPPRPPPPRPRPAPPPEPGPGPDYETEPEYPDYYGNSPNSPPHHRHHHPPDAVAPASSLALAPAPAPAPASAHASAPALASAPAPAACLDTGASPVGDCATVKSPSGCSPALSPAKKCATFKTYFDPKVAAAAVSCMAGLSSAQMCDSSQIVACSKAALAQACTDPSVTQVCQIAATKCKASAAECSVLLSGLNDEGQDKVAQCVAQGCPGGLFACVDGLK